MDGIPLSDSSKTALYPLVLYIFNLKDDKKLMEKLPLFKTFTIVNSENKNSNATKLSQDYELMVAGFNEEFEELKNGFMTDWHLNTFVSVKMIIADAPCRHDLCNFLRYNGVFPCLRCYIIFKQKPDGTKQFPLPLSNDLKMRTMEELEFALSSLRNSPNLKHWNGVKGPSVLEIPNFNLITGTIVDVMHAVFLGVYKNLLIGFMERTELDCYINKTQLIEKIDKRIEQLKPPSTFMRKLRSIQEFRNFKSIELQNHVFYLCFFLFSNVLPDSYLSHILLLSSAVFKLWSKHSTNDDLEHAKNEIDLYLVGLVNLGYDNWFIKYNSHILVHLYEDRINHGPLYFINQYSLEGQLQVYKGFLISKNKRVETLAKKVSLQFALNLKDLEKTSSKDTTFKNKIDNSIINPTDLNFIEQSTGVNTNKLICFNSCKLQSLDLSSFYSKSTADSYVKMSNSEYYSIILFFKINNTKKVLVKKIPIFGPLQRRIDFCQPNYYCAIKQLKKVDSLLYHSNENREIFDCKFIERKVFFARLESRSGSIEYCVDVEN